MNTPPEIEKEITETDLDSPCYSDDSFIPCKKSKLKKRKKKSKNHKPKKLKKYISDVGDSKEEDACEENIASLTEKSAKDSSEKTKEFDIKLAQRIYKGLRNVRQVATERREIYVSKDKNVFTFVVKYDQVIEPGKIDRVNVELENKLENEDLDSQVLCFEMHPSWEKHSALHIMDSITDMNNQFVMVSNSQNKSIKILKGTPFVSATILDSEKLPELHPDSMIDIFAIHNENKNVTKSPRQEALEIFENGIEKYNDKPEIKAILTEFKDVFVPENEHKLPQLKIDPVKIPLKSTDGKIQPTPQMRERSYKQIDVEAIEAFVEAGLLNDLLTEVISPVQNPLHVVRTEKFDENGDRIGVKTRITADCRKNNIINCGIFNYAFPTIEEELTRLNSIEANYFNSVDLVSGFHQIPVAEESIPLFAFPVYDGKFKGRTFAYKRLLFGWTSAPAIFSNIITKVFQNLESKDINARVGKYIDDLAFSCKTWKDQVIFLRRFLMRCRAFGVCLNFAKCVFAALEAIFCGHLISKKGISICPKRITLLKEYPKFDCRSRRKNADLTLLGFYGYHSKWVKNYSEKDRRMRDLIKKYKAKEIKAEECNDEIEKVTNEIKEEVLRTVVVTPTKNDTLTLISDSSGRSWGGTLYCDRGIIAYTAGTHPESISKTHTIYLLELRALALTIQKFYKFLCMGGPLIVKNDNFSATFCLNQRVKMKASTRAIQYTQNIAMWLSQFNPKMLFLGTKENALCDALSRLSYDKNGNFVQSEELPKPEYFFGKIPEDVAAIHFDNYKENLPTYPIILKSKSGCEAFKIEILNKEQRDIRQFIENIHQRCHWSYQKTVKTMQAAGMEVPHQVIKSVIENCKTCQNPRKIAPLSKLHPKPTPSEPLDELHLDFVDKNREHRSYQGHISIISMIDAMSRYAFAFPMKRFTIQPVIEKLREIFSIIGRKISFIYADNAFNYKPLVKFCKQENIELKFRASNLSRSVMVERWHRSLHTKISALTPDPRNWNIFLSQAVFSLNAQVHDSTGFTPYYLMFGHEHPVIPRKEIYEKDSDRLQAWEDCKFIARIMSDHEKLKYADITYKYPKLEKGNKVLIKYDPSKNGKFMEAHVVNDDGGAEVLLNLLNKNMKIRVHKGMVYVEKDTDGYEVVFNGTKYINRYYEKSAPKEIEKSTPRYPIRKNKNNLQIDKDKASKIHLKISDFKISKNSLSSNMCLPTSAKTQLKPILKKTRKLRSGKTENWFENWFISHARNTEQK